MISLQKLREDVSFDYSDIDCLRPLLEKDLVERSARLRGLLTGGAVIYGFMLVLTYFGV